MLFRRSVFALGLLIVSALSPVIGSAAPATGYAWGVAEGASPLPNAARFQGIYDNSTELPTFAFMARAQHTLDIEIYEMKDPDFRAGIRWLLSHKVRVRVIKDPNPNGSKCFPFTPASATDNAECLDIKKLSKEVTAAGGTFVPYNKAALCAPWTNGHCFEHGKIMLIDAGLPNQAALLSTGNFNSSNFCNAHGNPSTCNRDYSYISTDAEVIRTLSAVFNHDILGQAYDVGSFITPSAALKVTVSPLSLAPLVAFIRSAKSSILIQNQYLHEKNINQALIDAAKAGVKVYVNVASVCSFAPPDAAESNLSNPDSPASIFTAFEAAGIQIRLFTGSQLIDGRMGYLHAKAMVVDGKYAWMGSVNGSNMAASGNREFGVFFSNATMVTHLSNIIRHDLADPKGETWQEGFKCLRDPKRSSTDE